MIGDAKADFEILQPLHCNQSVGECWGAAASTGVNQDPPYGTIPDTISIFQITGVAWGEVLQISLGAGITTLPPTEFGQAWDEPWPIEPWSVVVPEPSTVLLFSIGLVGLATRHRRH